MACAWELIGWYDLVHIQNVVWCDHKLHVCCLGHHVSSTCNEVCNMPPPVIIALNIQKIQGNNEIMVFVSPSWHTENPPKKLGHCTLPQVPHTSFRIVFLHDGSFWFKYVCGECLVAVALEWPSLFIGFNTCTPWYTQEHILYSFCPLSPYWVHTINL